MKKVITIITTIIILISITIHIINTNKVESEVVETTESNIIKELEEPKEEIKSYITVEIKGEVTNPGVYKIEENSRVIDLIIIDESIPKLSSEDTLNKIKDTKCYKKSVILITKIKEFGSREMYQEKGFKDIIIEPIKKEEIINIVKEYIDK